ncbi:MAG: sulfatase-like hydrolase/transferase [Planctomycetota bacterium]
MKLVSTLAAFALPLLGAAPTRTPERLPNVVYVMADELAYYELSHMGNPYIRTPRIDRMAAEGTRFTRAYAGAPVCAPLRCNLMTGKHAGHASVRANDGGTPLRRDETTIGDLLKARGYATGGFGKWGCGGRDSTGVPEEHGFDVFLGYYDQVHAHSFYPPYLVRNSEEVELAGNAGGRSGETYSHYAIMDSALDFIREHKDEPFFCYLPITPPHGMYDIPSDDPAWELYRDAPWMEDAPQDVRNYAAMVSMVDRNVGQVLDLLAELELEDDTIVFFTGDNGGQDRFRSEEHRRGFFGPNVDPRTGQELRGGKGSLYEGGLRIPYLVRWPGRVPAGRVSEHLFYHPDVLPTLAELCGAETPDDCDGRSFLPELFQDGEQARHEFLYWEFGGQLAVRTGDWKGVLARRGRGDWDEQVAAEDAPWELYDLAVDPGEERDVAGEHPEVLKRLAALAAREHEPARPGSYTDPTRTRHERDRWAKWGTSKDRPKPKPPGKVHAIEGKGLLAGVELVSFSSQNVANGKLAANALDGDPRTHWHSAFSDGVAEHPHELVLDLGAEVEVIGLRYLARQDQGWNGAFAETELYLAMSPDGFAEAPDARATLGKKRAAQSLDLERPTRARYLKVRVLAEVNGGPWASAAELAVAAR